MTGVILRGLKLTTFIVFMSAWMVVCASCGRRDAIADETVLPMKSSSAAVKVGGAKYPHPSQPFMATPGKQNTVAFAEVKSAGLETQSPEREKTLAGNLPRADLRENQITAGVNANKSNGVVATAPSTRLQIPLAAVGHSPSLHLNADEMSQVVRLGQDFLAATDDGWAATPSPSLADANGENAPARAVPYNSNRWLTAQEQSDEQFTALFGISAYNAQQLARAQQAFGEQLKGE